MLPANFDTYGDMASYTADAEKLYAGSLRQPDTLAQQPTHATYIDRNEIASLSQDHRDYLLQRHGTLDLDPVPGFGDADPYNWPGWKKISNLILVVFHALMSTFTAASIFPAYGNIAEEFGVSIPQTSYLTSLQIAILGGASLFWRPLCNRYGRRPIFLLSLLCSLAGNIGCAKSRGYASMAACRAIVAFFISPAAAIGSAVVAETFFKRDRAKWMGVWTVMVTLGVPLSPFLFGCVTYHVGYRWIYWILAITNGVQFILYLFLGPESRYIRQGVEHEGSSFKQEYLSFRRIDPTPLRLFDFVQPLFMGRHLSILIPACAYAMVFLFGSVLTTVEIPQLFEAKFQFNAQQLGLQFLGLIVGSLIGEQLGGHVSDLWMRCGGGGASSRSRGLPVPPERRLWLAYPGYLLTIVGIVVFLVQIDHAPAGRWNVSPIVGSGIAAAGNQIVTTILITYAVDCHREEAASVGVFITCVRGIWGFIGPFWLPDMFTSVGVANSAWVVTILIMAVSFVPTALLHWKRAVRPKGGPY